MAWAEYGFLWIRVWHIWMSLIAVLTMRQFFNIYITTVVRLDWWWDLAMICQKTWHVSHMANIFPVFKNRPDYKCLLGVNQVHIDSSNSVDKMSGLSFSQITKIWPLHKCTVPVFGGCLSADAILPSCTKHPIFYIINSEPSNISGKHWLLTCSVG